ncbi:unnamed protein product [Schistosoma margrebowiei]|uniref:Uncharacterized protein n=1 Tax=Schistosoma margrebowiei TaxID=48269 RepID=A0A183MVZ3_9TREM|nr:unnamed protein product [Schistosoma margrebowiei]
MDHLLELELAKVRLALTEKEIELERLRQKGREHYNEVMADKAMTTVMVKAKNTIVHCALSEPEEGYRKALELFEYGLLVNRGSNSGYKDVGVLKMKFRTDNNAARISYASASDGNSLLRSSSCLECSSNHSLDQCQKFKDKNVRERKEFVLRHKLCNVYL